MLVCQPAVMRVLASVLAVAWLPLLAAPRAAAFRLALVFQLVVAPPALVLARAWFPLLAAPLAAAFQLALVFQLVVVAPPALMALALS